MCSQWRFDAGAAEVVASRVLPRKRNFKEAAAANPNLNFAIEPPPKKGPGRPPKVLVTPFQGHVVQLNHYPLINEKTGRKSFVEGSLPLFFCLLLNLLCSLSETPLHLKGRGFTVTSSLCFVDVAFLVHHHV
jgi:hypothetical protein